jgi:hypothetical protein
MRRSYAIRCQGTVALLKRHVLLWSAEFPVPSAPVNIDLVDVRSKEFYKTFLCARNGLPISYIYIGDVAMTDGASNQPKQSGSLNRPSAQDEPLVHVPLRASDARRSVHNILQWNSYLPTYCVRKMVSMGWDYTT